MQTGVPELKLNLGCGQVRPDGWVNTDSSINSLIQQVPLGKRIAKLIGLKEYSSRNVKYMNLNKNWHGIKDNSVDVVYASHLFEHLSPKSARLFLAEAYRTIKPGGVIRLVVPDLYALAKQYTSSYESGDREAYKELMWALNLHLEGQYPSKNKLHRLIGWFQGFPHQHKYMYDFYALGERLESSGFSKITHCRHGKSPNILYIEEVENDVWTGYRNSLYLEGIKQP